eukprot:6047538-Prymnesium_polylepis.1
MRTIHGQKHAGATRATAVFFDLQRRLLARAFSRSSVEKILEEEEEKKKNTIRTDRPTPGILALI